MVLTAPTYAVWRKCVIVEMQFINAFIFHYFSQNAEIQNYLIASASPEALYGLIILIDYQFCFYLIIRCKIHFKFHSSSIYNTLHSYYQMCWLTSQMLHAMMISCSWYNIFDTIGALKLSQLSHFRNIFSWWLHQAEILRRADRLHALLLHNDF